MADQTSITTLVQLFILLLNAALAIIYIVPIFALSRFHTAHNLLTANLACAILSCVLSWIVGFALREFQPDIYSVRVYCAWIYFLQSMCTIQVPLAALQGSFHRLLSIVYFRSYFNTKHLTVFICFLIQWTIGFLVTIPHAFPQRVRTFFPLDRQEFSVVFKDCVRPRWQIIYGLVTLVVIPSIISTINNILIFTHVHSSSNRVQSSLSIVGPSRSSASLSTRHRRDIHLARHMIFMLCIFMIGWTPMFTFGVIRPNYDVDMIVFATFTLIAEVCLSINLLNLFSFNHELRRYLFSLFPTCW